MTFSASRQAGHHHDINTQNSRSMGRKRWAPRLAASEHCQLMLQCNALPNQSSAGTMICPERCGEPNHWWSLCPTAKIRQRSGLDEILRRDSRALEGLLRADDIHGELAERYGYVNRSLPDAELDGFVDALAMPIASSTVPASPEAGYNTI